MKFFALASLFTVSQAVTVRDANVDAQVNWLFSHLDTNKDGYIEWNEVQAAVNWVCTHQGRCPTAAQTAESKKQFESVAGDDQKINKKEMKAFLRS